MEQVHLHDARTSVLRRNCAEQAVIFAARACCEVEGVGVVYSVGAEDQSPQSRVGDDFAGCVLELAEKISCGGVEGVDGAVVKVSE